MSPALSIGALIGMLSAALIITGFNAVLNWKERQMSEEIQTYSDEADAERERTHQEILRSVEEINRIIDTKRL